MIKFPQKITYSNKTTEEMKEKIKQWDDAQQLQKPIADDYKEEQTVNRPTLGHICWYSQPKAAKSAVAQSI